MIGLDFVDEPGSHQGDPALRDRVAQSAFERGLLTLPAGPSALRLSPPLIVGQAEVDTALGLLDSAIAEALT